MHALSPVQLIRNSAQKLYYTTTTTTTNHYMIISQPDCCLTCRGWRRSWSCTMPQSCCTSQQHCRRRTSSILTSSLTTCCSGRLPAQDYQPGIPANLACGPKLACASLTMAELLTQLSCLQTPSSRLLTNIASSSCSAEPVNMQCCQNMLLIR